MNLKKLKNYEFIEFLELFFVVRRKWVFYINGSSDPFRINLHLILHLKLILNSSRLASRFYKVFKLKSDTS